MREIMEFGLSPETAVFLASELQEILKHSDITEKVSLDLHNLQIGLLECDEVRLLLTD